MRCFFSAGSFEKNASTGRNDKVCNHRKSRAGTKQQTSSTGAGKLNKTMANGSIGLRSGGVPSAYTHPGLSFIEPVYTIAQVYQVAVRQAWLVARAYNGEFQVAHVIGGLSRFFRQMFPEFPAHIACG